MYQEIVKIERKKLPCHKVTVVVSLAQKLGSENSCQRFKKRQINSYLKKKKLFHAAYVECFSGFYFVLLMGRRVNINMNSMRG